jgi:S-adenosyl-L-methionine hydrolase (adenosine-forming)
MRPIVTLLTDFGTADGYVAEVKGTILARAPEAVLVDVAHDVTAHDVEAGRLALARYWRKFPPGTVHLAVVDPDVGSSRRALAVESDGRFLVGPDNGLLSPALLLAGARAVSLPVPQGASPTFHGRDVFAPAAAMLLTGTAVDGIGTPIADPVVRRTAEARRNDAGLIEGRVITVDRFGNAVTNLMAAHGGTVELAGLRLPVQRTYADAAPGAALALVGSSGLIEIAVRNGSAASLLGIERGSVVLLRPARR